MTRVGHEKSLPVSGVGGRNDLTDDDDDDDDVEEQLELSTKHEQKQLHGLG